MTNAPEPPPVINPERDQRIRQIRQRKTTAGVCGIMLGGLGVHKFVLGFHNAGMLMAAFWMISLCLGFCFVLPLVGAMAMSGIGFVEGVIYLTKPDRDFYQDYMIEKREWF